MAKARKHHVFEELDLDALDGVVGGSPPGAGSTATSTSSLTSNLTSAAGSAYNWVAGTAGSVVNTFNSFINPAPSGGAAGYSYVPAAMNPDGSGSIIPGHSVGPDGEPEPGGNDSWGIQVGGNIGPYAATLTVTTGGWAISPAVSAGLPLGGYVDVAHVSPNPGETTQSVLDGLTVGADAHAIVGGSFEANPSGTVQTFGVGAGAGVSVSYGLNAGPPTMIPGDQLPTNFQGLNLQQGYQDAVAQAQADHPFSMTEAAQAGNQYVQNANDYIQAVNGITQSQNAVASMQNLQAIAGVQVPTTAAQFPTDPNNGAPQAGTGQGTSGQGTAGDPVGGGSDPVGGQPGTPGTPTPSGATQPTPDAGNPDGDPNYGNNSGVGQTTYDNTNNDFGEGGGGGGGGGGGDGGGDGGG
jgi:hypothetical protein